MHMLTVILLVMIDQSPFNILVIYLILALSLFLFAFILIHVALYKLEFINSKGVLDAHANCYFTCHDRPISIQHIGNLPYIGFVTFPICFFF